ncbi:MAG: type 4a pilus biogenesis protein PilO [Solirubrobacterales bacterium]
MGGNDRTILLIVPVVAALVAFWFMALSPKRDEVGKLDSQISTLRSEVQSQEQAATAGLAAREQFPRDYHRLVVMGKAVPVDDQTASLLVQINKIAGDTGVSFRAINLSQGGGAATAPAPAPAPPADATAVPADATAAPATESAASLLPIGATVGSAGLPTLPYELVFRGTYFEVADFMAGVDRLVKTGKGRLAADGRLVTIDGFSLSADNAKPYPVVRATMNVTTYVTPADQGLTAGATPAGPSTVPPTTPASATTSTTP